MFGDLSQMNEVDQIMAALSLRLIDVEDSINESWRDLEIKISESYKKSQEGSSVLDLKGSAISMKEDFKPNREE